MLIRVAAIIALCLGISSATANFASFQIAGSPTCAFSKDIVADYGADPTGLVDVNSAFNTFGAAALAWQTGGGVGTVCLSAPANSTFFFGQTGAGASPTAGIKSFIFNGNTSTLSDTLLLATSASTSTSSNLLNYTSVPSGIIVGLPIFDNTTSAAIPSCPAPDFNCSSVIVVAKTSTTVSMGVYRQVTANTPSGSALTFPASGGVDLILNGSVVSDVSNPSAISGGTTVSSVVGNVVNLNQAIASTVLASDTIQFTVNAVSPGVGSGDTIGYIGNGLFIGAGRNGGGFGDNLHYVNFLTVSAGAASITLDSSSPNFSSCSTLFHNGDWVSVTGLDMQGFGQPLNVRFHEYKQIASINCSTGVTSFTTNIKFSYDENWPNYGAGSAFAPYLGGPATMFALHQEWVTNQTYNGLNFRNYGAQEKAAGQYMTFNNCSSDGRFGIPPTETILMTFNNCNFTQLVEADKEWENVLVNGGQSHGWLFQSAGAYDTWTFNNHHVLSVISGTPGKLVIQNGSQIDPGLGVGAVANGTSVEVDCTNSTVSTGVTNGGFADNTFAAEGATITNGVIAIPLASERPIPWAIPHTYAAWDCRFIYCGTFEVLNVTRDTVNTYIQTDQVGMNAFPSYKFMGTETFTGVVTLPGIANFNNCSGSADAVDLSQVGAQNKPLWSYSKRDYTGSNTSQIIPVWGLPSQVNISVPTAYTGAGTPTFGLGNGGGDVFYNDGTGNVSATWAPVINPKNPGGAHTVAITPTTVTGTQTGDSVTAPGASSWLMANQQQPSFTSTITGVDVSVEFIMNQGITVPPP